VSGREVGTNDGDDDMVLVGVICGTWECALVGVVLWHGKP